MVGAAEKELKEKGVQFVKADKQAFYKATQPIRDKYGAKWPELIKRIEATK
jgi:TRAP-type C4-dicarboxylate transport system substrate-binding protein